jgi:hypothetical protein
VSIPDDVDAEWLISRLSGPLAPAARQIFRSSAEAALAAIPCSGEGVVYRTLVRLQRDYFVPPSDAEAARDVALERRGRAPGGVSQLRAAAPLGCVSTRDRVRKYERT